MADEQQQEQYQSILEKLAELAGVNISSFSEVQRQHAASSSSMPDLESSLPNLGPPFRVDSLPGTNVGGGGSVSSNLPPSITTGEGSNESSVNVNVVSFSEQAITDLSKLCEICIGTGQGISQGGQNTKGNRLGSALGAGQNLLSSFAKPMNLQNIGQMLTSPLNLLGNVLPGKLGLAIGAIGKFGEAVFKVVDGLQKLNRSVYESNVRFADVSPSMAGVQARQSVRDMMENIRRGERLAASAEGQAEAMNRIEKSINKIVDSFQIVQNNTLSKFGGVISAMFDGVGNVLLRIAKNTDPKPEDTTTPFEEFLGDMGPDWYTRWGLPQRFSTGSVAKGAAVGGIAGGMGG